MLRVFSLLVFSMVLLVVPGNAQTFEWVKSLHTYNGSTTPSDVRLGHDGSIFITGLYQGNPDFDPDAGIDTLGDVGYDDYGVFVAKYDTSGSLVWTIRILTTDFAYAGAIDCIQIDPQNDIVVGGSFLTWGIFEGSDTVTTNATYIAKFSADGTLQWHKHIDAGGPAAQYGMYGLAVNSMSEIFILGTFVDTVDFDPGPALYETQTANGNTAAYLLKLSSAGEFIWLRKFDAVGLGSYSSANALKINASGELYVLGKYQLSMDLDPDPGVTNVVSTVNTEYFVTKLDADGMLVWAKTFFLHPGTGTTVNEKGTFDIDSQGNLLIAGYFNGTGDFNPGPEVDTLTSVGASGWMNAIFLLKLTSDGDFVWVRNIVRHDENGTYGPSAFDVVTDKHNNVYATGSFTYTADFDPGLGAFYLTSLYGGASFLTKLDPNGNWIAAMPWSQVRMHAAIVDSTGNVFVGGPFQTEPFTSADFDPGVGTFTLTSSYKNSAFILKLGQDLCSEFGMAIDSASDFGCGTLGFASTHAFNGLPPYQYAWNNGTQDSALTVTQPGLHSITVTDASGCMRHTNIVITDPQTPQGFDMHVHAVGGVFRPAQPTFLQLHAANDGCVTTVGQVRLILDSAVTFNYATPQPDAVDGDTLSWNYNGLDFLSAPFAPTVYLTTDTFAAIGSEVCFSVQITPTVNDGNAANNVVESCFTVVNSYDPNIISVTPVGACDEHYALRDSLLTYTVQFQNTGSAPALNVVILDSLPQGLDPSSVRVLGKSHSPLITELLPGNVLKFSFNGIALVDSATNEPESQGYVVYEAKPFGSVPDGMILTNRAAIYFDFNEPVLTNTVFNTSVGSIPSCTNAVLEFEKVGVTIYPNPTQRDVVISFPYDQETVTIELLDVYGRKLLTQTAMENPKTFELPSAPGLYFLRLVDHSGSTVLHKVVKQ